MKKVLTVTMDGSPYKKALSLIFALQIRGKCFCLAHYEVTIAKDTVNSQ